MTFSEMLETPWAQEGFLCRRVLSFNNLETLLDLWDLYVYVEKQVGFSLFSVGHEGWAFEKKEKIIELWRIKSWRQGVL
jgi:hypothetical protein